MTAEIKPLYANHPAPERRPQEDVIAMLRDALARAECGELQGIAFIEVDRDGRGSFWINRPVHVAFPDMIAHAARLQKRLLDEWESRQPGSTVA